VLPPVFDDLLGMLCRLDSRLLIGESEAIENVSDIGTTVINVPLFMNKVGDDS